jgi:hypothetical protein
MPIKLVCRSAQQTHTHPQRNSIEPKPLSNGANLARNGAISARNTSDTAKIGADFLTQKNGSISARNFGNSTQDDENSAGKEKRGVEKDEENGHTVLLKTSNDLRRDQLIIGYVRMYVYLYTYTYMYVYVYPYHVED